MVGLSISLRRYGARTADDAETGSLARIGPNMLLTTDLELLRRMSAARSSYVRSKWYLAFRLAPEKDNVFSMLDDKAHTKRRAQMNNGVSRGVVASQRRPLLIPVASIWAKKISPWNLPSIRIS